MCILIKCLCCTQITNMSRCVSYHADDSRLVGITTWHQLGLRQARTEAQVACQGQGLHSCTAVELPGDGCRAAGIQYGVVFLTDTASILAGRESHEEKDKEMWQAGDCKGTSRTT